MPKTERADKGRCERSFHETAALRGHFRHHARNSPYCARQIGKPRARESLGCVLRRNFVARGHRCQRDLSVDGRVTNDGDSPLT